MTNFIDPRHKILWHIDRLDAVKTGYKPMPINLEIDLTNRCSLGCEWCHFAYTHTRGPLAGKVDTPEDHTPGGDVMRLDLAKHIIREVRLHGVRSITWTGGGEPTLHPHFDEIITYAHENHVDQGLYTHGGHINAPRAILLRERLKWVYVSLDECTQEQYKTSKGVDGFTRALNGIQYLAKARGEATIGVGYLLHPGNYMQTANMINLAFSLGADYVQFRPTVSYSQINPAMPAGDIGWLDDCIAQLQTIDNPNVLADVERFEMYRDWNGRGYDTCHWAQLQSVITPDGSMWVCVNKREHTGAKLGNLADESLLEIWQRSGAHEVDGGCRVMCRGHMANITLDSIMTPPPHRNFI